MKKICKSVLSFMLVLVVVFGLVTPIVPSVLASEFSNFYTDSDMWLVDSNTHKTASTIYLYGKADYICLKLKQTDKYNDIFCFTLYSNSKRTKEVLNYSTEYSKVGKKYITFPIAFDDLKSGTYYAETYVYKRCRRRPSGVWLPDSYEPREVDEGTRRTYKIKIVKKGTNIDEMNTVMYGFENTEKGPKIYWYSVPGAKGYYIYRKNPKTKKYEKIKTVKNSGKKFKSYTDKTYKGKNATRYYKVVAYKGSSKTSASLISLKVKSLKTPTVKTEMMSDNRIKISWSKVSKNAKYTVYSRRNDSDVWEKVATVNGKLNYVTSDQKYYNNKTYCFTVVANVGSVDSGYNKKGVALHYLEYPELKPCTYPENGGITLNWKPVVGADSYKIYRKQKTNEEWLEVGVVKGNLNTQYTDLTANDKDFYYYNVRSVRNGVNGSIDKDGVSATILRQPELLDIKDVDGQKIKISWNKIPNNCEYTVMKKTTSGWKEVASTKDNYYVYDMNSTISTETFTVKAVRNQFTSDFDKNGLTYSLYPRVVVSNLEVSEAGAKLQWKKPTNAGQSVIYKKIGDGKFVLFAETDDVTIVDDSVEIGVNYTYRIAYKYNNEIIENAAVEQPLTVNTEIVELEDLTYNTTFSNGYKSFTTKIKNYDAESIYQVYRKTETGWIKVGSTVTPKGEITVKSQSFDNVESFEIARITPQGDCTIITEPTFTVGFVSDYIPSTLVTATVEKEYPTIRWSADSTKAADKIHIYRKALASNNGYQLAGIVSATQNLFVDKSAKPNCFYDYQLRVEKDCFVSYGGPKAQVNFMGKPQINFQNENGNVCLSWNGISGAKKYEVYRKLPNDDKWGVLTTTDVTYYRDKTAQKFVGYQYMVKAIDANGNESPCGISDVWKYVPLVTDFKAKNKSKTNKLTWKAVSGADGYIITYKDYSVSKRKWSAESQPIKILGGSKTSYTDKTISANVVREYLICAYYDDYKGMVTGYEGAGYLSKQPKIKSLSSTKKGVKIKIGKVSNIEEYVVYKKGPKDKKWKKLKTTYSRTITDKNVKAGKKYSYTVKSRCNSTGSPIYSTYKKSGWSITYKP